MKKVVAVLLGGLMLFPLVGNGALAKEMDASITLKDLQGHDKKISVNLPDNLPDTESRIKVILDELLSGKYESDKVFSEIPNGTKIKGIKLDGNKLTINLNKSFTKKLTNNHNVGFILDSFLGTVFQFDEVDEVEFLVEGKKIKYLDMYDFSIPFKRDNENQEKKDKNQKISPRGNDIGADPIIVVDPGHGGKDPGAVASDGTEEADLNLKIALKLRDYLEDNLDATVYMTRTTDKYVDYEDRYDLANEKNADLFISVHLNSVTNTSVDGTTAIYPNNHDISVSKDAADFIHQRVTNVLDEYTDPYKDNRNLSVLRNTDVPAVITETGFISNSSDLKFLKSSDGQEEIAYEIYRGIKNWWND